MAKEIIKPNEVAAPTIFIGVGGTGSDIVRRVAEMCQPEELENINFVCLDTNVNDLMNIKNSKRNIYFVQTSNTQTVGDYLDYDEDARRNWFPKNSVMYDKTVSEGAGQVRAISRLALNSTIKTGKIAPLYDAIDDLFRKNGNDLKQALRVVFASTSSGGTGSGIILPLSMFVRDYVKEKYPNTALIERALILLPETLDSVISSTTERLSQRRNGYATIKEINAFMMKGSGFFDIDPDLARYKDLAVAVSMPGSDEKKTLDCLPFDFCFLMDGQDAEDSTLKNYGQYKMQAAQALYEQNIGPMQKQAFSVEDNIIKEMSNPGNLGRNRFGGIGASVIRYPYEDVVKYVAYSWAKSAIGGEGEAAKWSKYDNKFKIQHEEDKKKGLSEDESCKLGDVYIETLRNGQDNFSKDLRARYLGREEERIEEYFEALVEVMEQAVAENSHIASAASAASGAANEIDYKDESNRNNGQTMLDALREYETAVNRFALKSAESRAASIFENEKKTINEKQPYTIEKLLKNSTDEIAHPNAVRYLLYRLEQEYTERLEDAQSQLDQCKRGLEMYSPDASASETFDAGYTKKKKESNIDELIGAEKDANIMEKLGGYEKIYAKFNEVLPDYYRKVESFGKLTAQVVAYKAGIEYVRALSKMFKKFYETFPDKVKAMDRKQDEIIESIRFNKGDSILNVCATKPILEELANNNSAAGAEGAMLNSELNGMIFDAVKFNVKFEKETANADFIEDDKRKDIFDDILLGYFETSVRDNCEALDVNIIKAIALENRIAKRIKLRETMQGENKTVVDKVTFEDGLRYIRKVIEKGSHLAAPSIQRIRNEEPREVRVVAYNKSLDDMREYKMDEDMFGKGGQRTSTDTVSKYEMHFFNAMYNLTPDKLNNFSAHQVSETREKKAGLYHQAYVDYSKNLGPDSTKNMLISTHIDKRWDSIAAMPEMDLNYQAAQMLRIHQAMIYALIYRAIKYKNFSQAAGAKMVFSYENSEERELEMIVSNGTLCDEFYEVLDSLYIDKSIVEDIYVIVENKRKKDNVKHSNYMDTVFAKSVDEFTLPIAHQGVASLFEVPIVYYNSLPNSQRYTGEITGLIDAVIATIYDELRKRESQKDAKFLLCTELEKQFNLLMDNYDKIEEVNAGIPAADNQVIDIIYRKLRKTVGATPAPEDEEVLLNRIRQRILNSKIKKTGKTEA